MIILYFRINYIFSEFLLNFNKVKKNEKKDFPKFTKNDDIEDIEKITYFYNNDLTTNEYLVKINI